MSDAPYNPRASTCCSSTTIPIFAVRWPGVFCVAAIRCRKPPAGKKRLSLAEHRQFDVAVVDMMMPGLSGLELLERLKADHAEIEVILLTGQGTIESAVQAMKLGAYDYLTKPFPLAELELLIEKAYEHRVLRKENQQLQAVVSRTQATPEIIGKSPAMQELFRLIERAGPTDKAILIQGESGTGKELVARAFHRRERAPSDRSW